ncbi:MAG: methyltransferase domain-containing protein [Clostridia bacterium]|nr:methyltransferase domain-containing protein [Clostridia bacterium]
MTDSVINSSRDREICRRLEQIRVCYELGDLQKSAEDPEAIASYYRASDFYYNVVHSRGGHAIHMGLSKDGVFRHEDLFAQAEFVAEQMTPETRSVLELGAGKAANTKYLAPRFSDVSFTALDLPDRNFLRTRVPDNVRLVEGDYHDLSCFAASSFDLVFAVKTICHSDRKETVYREVARVLRPGGRLIVFDVFEPKPISEMSVFERDVDAVVLGSMCVTERNQWIGDMVLFLEKSGFSGITVSDLTDQIQPSLKRLERYAEQWFTHGKARRLFRKLINEKASRTSIAGWLMPLCFDGIDLLQYNRVVAVKNGLAGTGS